MQIWTLRLSFTYTVTSGSYNLELKTSLWFAPNCETLCVAQKVCSADKIPFLQNETLRDICWHYLILSTNIKCTNPSLYFLFFWSFLLSYKSHLYTHFSLKSLKTIDDRHFANLPFNQGFQFVLDIIRFTFRIFSIIILLLKVKWWTEIYHEIIKNRQEPWKLSNPTISEHKFTQTSYWEPSVKLHSFRAKHLVRAIFKV